MGLSNAPSEGNEAYGKIYEALKALTDTSETSIAWSPWGQCCVEMQTNGDIHFFNAESELIATIKPDDITPSEATTKHHALNLLGFNFPTAGDHTPELLSA